MSVVIMIVQLILGLSILVILHELGHFLAARAFGIKVEKFYLFFDAWNVSLVKFNYKGVEYGIGWLPLGGYVKIAGMIDESMDTEQMAGPPQPWEFRSKPAWQRLIVMLAGIFVNIVLGIFIFWMLTVKYGDSYTLAANVKYGIAPGSVGRKIGLMAGDKITEVNGKPLLRYDELHSSNVLMNNTKLTVLRGDKTVIITIPPTILNDLSDNVDEFINLRSKFKIDSVMPGSNAYKAGLQKGDSIVAVNKQPIEFYDQLQDAIKQNINKKLDLTIKRNNVPKQLIAQVSADGTLGFYRDRDSFPKETTETYSFFGSLPVGASKAWLTFAANAKGLGKVFKGEVKATKAFAGPVEIATMFGGHIDWLNFWRLVGLLSMALALMNLLPIPVLDGGHAMFLVIEMIKGKPLNDKFMERAQIVGFVILITLMVFVYGNSILKHFIKY
ncbi:regulator of sigma E protease [Mucilaginibacter gracilis]|uniref:Zinc metalloprotease n=1 Tax=Mucilaginibacter gracilis TaxID=423350 RepID=A0A495J4S7_9SPHI|nr:RIP metalloprotease RseP [Mucilaginibacter gracilis]RKR83975.1 regulator of sigma E protease [Mucilaginibacter gracilis]